MEKIPGQYYRTCQECDHEQKARDPQTYNNDKWRDVKCRKCGSEALDYGSYYMPVTEIDEDYGQTE